MAASPLRLLAARRFGPLCATQTLSAFTDNLAKNALVVLALFRLGDGGAGFTALAGALFIAPYALLSATAGQLADRYPKPWLIRLNKLAELALMVVAAVGFLTGSVTVLLAVLAGLGAQAALFSPLKYGSLPEHLDGAELVVGNGLIEAGSFLGIVAGTVAGGGLMLAPHGGLLVAAVGLVAALLGLATAWRIPAVPAADPHLQIGRNPLRETVRVIVDARGHRVIWLCILALSWFWALGATVLTELPVVVRDVIGAPGTVLTAALAIFAVGVGIGSVSCAWLLHGEVSPRQVPAAAVGLAIFLADFAWSTGSLGGMPHPVSPAALLHEVTAWRAGIDLLLLAVCGGMFSVPLYAIVQARSPRAGVARMIAANNIANAVAMVLGAIAVTLLAAIGVAPHVVLAIAAALELIAAGVIVWLIPREALRPVFRWIFSRLYRTDLRGLEHYRAAGSRLVAVSNHLSFGDAALLAAFLPDDVVFAIHTGQMRKLWVRVAKRIVEVFPVDVQSPYSVKRMVEAVRAGKKLVLFPEGRLSRTGGLMKIYEGAGLVADKAGAKLLPIVIDGLQFTPLGKMRGRVQMRRFPRLSVQVMAPVTLAPDPALPPRKRRAAVGQALEDIMVTSAFRARNTDQSLFSALLDARRRHGGTSVACDDITRQPMTHDTLLLAACALGRRLAREVPLGGTIGVMLPNTKAAAATFIGLQAFGRVPAMLNHAGGADAMLSACTSAEVTTVISSRAFIAKGKLENIAARMAEHVRFVWLEEVRAEIGWAEKLRGKLDAAFAHRLPGAGTPADRPCVVLFTSGSEGAPKGVLLSSRNLLSNCAQVGSVIDFHGGDKVFSALPLFHSFGLVGGLILPLLSGVATFQYPSPLHYRIVSNMIYDTESTIVFGTDTFLSGWARFAHPYDFHEIRYVFAGAERVREETRRLFADRFGVRVLEGYGATETSPVIALSTAMHNRPGSVGRFMPGLEWALDPVEGIEGAGRLRVRGPNVMLGYLRAAHPGVLEPPPGGWYDTGDIVAVDADGFVSIRGRAKRFAKLAGEMVSMTAAENLVASLWPGEAHAVIAVPDPRKGEALLLVTTRADAEPRAILEHARSRFIPEIMVPRAVLHVAAVPLLATGKANYPAVQHLAAQARTAGLTPDFGTRLQPVTPL